MVVDKRVQLEPTALEHCQFMVDGEFVPGNLVGQAIPKGDTTEPSIIAASIVARVCRDGTMRSLSRKWSEFDFSVDGGHSSSQHLRQIVKYGPCAAHRCSCFPFARRTGRRMLYHPQRGMYACTQRLLHFDPDSLLSSDSQEELAAPAAALALSASTCESCAPFGVDM